MVKDTAVSVGQVANETVNQKLKLAEPFVGTDIAARVVGKVSAGVGESMRGEVTPMDVINTASLVPLPAGVGAKVAVPLAKRIGIPLAESIKAAFKVPGLPVPAFVGVGNVGGALARTGAPQAASDALRYTPQAVGVGVQGANVTYASGPDLAGMATTPKYRSEGSSRTTANKQQRYAFKRYQAGGSAKDYVSWAKEFLAKNKSFNPDLYPDPSAFNMGHDLTKPYSGGKFGPRQPTHYVDAALNRAAEALIASNKIDVTTLKSGKDYSSIIKYILDNPNDLTSKTVLNQHPGLKTVDSFEEAVKILNAGHLLGPAVKNSA
jgi:hypothetical protein